jgi:hypothetical protein
MTLTLSIVEFETGGFQESCRLGGCPRIEAVTRESGFEAIFLIKMRRILVVFNEFNRKNGSKSAFP